MSFDITIMQSEDSVGFCYKIESESNWHVLAGTADIWEGEWKGDTHDLTITFC